ncbi:MAG TPA: efflux RND transporter permease subunit, partial [Beijerinckiaceae bacterium]
VRDVRAAGWYNGAPAVVLNVTKEPAANVIETIEGVRAVLPELARFMPEGVDVHVLSDRSTTIRASVADLEKTLAISIGLVTMVVFLFLRRLASTVAAAVTVPLSLAGAFCAMWACGFTIDNLSLMAITISVGFVVDDAIVMIENVHRNMERGMGRLEAALAGLRQIAFTVVSISLSLVAAFMPLLFMQGIVGRVFREFGLTLTFAILVSMIVSLTVTPMICGRFLPAVHPPPSRLDRLVDGALGLLQRGYARTLDPALRHPFFVLTLFLAVIALTIQLYRVTPKGWFPQDDTGLLSGWTEAAPNTSFEAMKALQQRAAEIVAADPAVESVASFIGSGSSNSGRLTIALKTEALRGGGSRAVVARLRPQLARVVGLSTSLWQMQDVRAGGREGRSQYQFTLWGADYPLLLKEAERVLARLRATRELVDVASDADRGGLQANVVVDRLAAARLGVSAQAISTALSDAFSQRQIATIYTGRNQYRVVLEIAPDRLREPGDLLGVYVSAANG